MKELNSLSLNTRSIYGKKEKSDGIRVLVTRFYPRGVKRTHFDLWIRDASPETALLKEYRSQAISWGEFSKRFRRQMRTSPNSKKAVQQLVEIFEKGENVTLLCYEKEGEKCHRNLLKAVVESTAKRKNKIRAGRPTKRTERMVSDD